MFISLKTKIWLTVLTIVLLFSFFSLFYYPEQQAKAILDDYKKDVQNYADRVAFGVKIALNQQDYEGVTKALESIKTERGLKFVSLIQIDSI